MITREEQKPINFVDETVGVDPPIKQKRNFE